ncbi:radical SAM protein [Parasedimentitalea psychrophila]|uniref:Radical SAM protein n=1 Tax=Parasedimentitalea psychrophila TaxID=2997337 RepID=A0A9Y2KYM2_9RHOB|nr:radical SAM protein [Parasedimentitalea psychrophila]WIY24849.1 radical SAM protein [Parasedimentitalea psychrophila]
MKDLPQTTANVGKFQHSHVTANGESRAVVALSHPETLWFNTGTLCNIECTNCYILSSPSNDALVYLNSDEVRNYLDQVDLRNWPIKEIGFTGGEPFMNPQMIDMARAALQRGYRVLILTNAMQPMMRKTVQTGLRQLICDFPGKLELRVSLDHFSAEFHDAERGVGSFQKTVQGMHWLQENGFTLAVAGRGQWGKSDADCRSGYAALFAEQGFDIDANNPSQTVLFPEMDETVEVPEITTACWGILGKSPKDVMCSSSRMVVKRKGASEPTVVACTLLPYTPEFDLGPSLQDAEQDIALNHPHCAKFCVLGGASCSA